MCRRGASCFFTCTAAAVGRYGHGAAYSGYFLVANKLVACSFRQLVLTSKNDFLLSEWGAVWTFSAVTFRVSSLLPQVISSRQRRKPFLCTRLLSALSLLPSKGLLLSGWHAADLSCGHLLVVGPSTLAKLASVRSESGALSHHHHHHRHNNISRRSKSRGVTRDENRRLKGRTGGVLRKRMKKLSL